MSTNSSGKRHPNAFKAYSLELTKDLAEKCILQLLCPQTNCLLNLDEHYHPHQKTVLPQLLHMRKPDKYSLYCKVCVIKTSSNCF